MEKQIINDTGLDNTNGTAAYTGLQTVKVGAKYLFDAPAVWSEISRESEQGQSLPFDEVIVSADVTKWRRDAAPGISASYHSNTTPQEAAGEFVARSRDFFASCKAGPQHEYDDGSNVGVARTYTDCTGQAGSDETLLAVKPNDSTDVIVVDSVVKDARDAAAIALAIRSVRAVTP